MGDLRIVESRQSTWVFHLSDSGDLGALCGAATMNCPAPLASWGDVTTVGERYCAECGRLAGPEYERKPKHEREKEQRDE
jgi:hypothetical protein